ncbi:MAG: DUF45 domain-containing protein [Clostridia bacterium]|nr:DUF45 domain-containing protein [Clostridia bacterium]
MRYFKGKKHISYELVLNKDDPFTYEIKDSVVYLNVKENRDCKEIWEFLFTNFDKLYRKSYDAEYRRFDGKEVVHYLGKTYIAKAKKSDKNEMLIDKYTLTVYCRNNTAAGQRAVFRKYLKQAVEQVLVKIYYELEDAFKEIKLPDFVVKGLDRGSWAYNDLGANTVYLSYQLGRYDEKYIKAIVYHEVCHCFIIEHNADFYKLLDSKLEGGSTLEKEVDKIIYNDKF